MKRLWQFFENHTSNVVVVLSYLLVFIFTTVCLVLITRGFEIDSTLTEWVFKFFGIEMIALSGIKISKNRKDFNPAKALNDIVDNLDYGTSNSDDEEEEEIIDIEESEEDEVG